MSETIPEDEDRGGDGAIGGAVGGEQTGSGFGLEGDPEVDDVGGIGADPGATTDAEDDHPGGTGADDGGPGSQNM